MLGKQVDLACLSRELEPWLTHNKQPDTIVLGCTHFPLIQSELAHIMPDACWVDSGEAIARRVAHLLELPFRTELIDDVALQLNTVFYTQESPALNMLKLSLQGVDDWILISGRLALNVSCKLFFVCITYFECALLKLGVV